jgi:Tfp pilus assembly protein PilW
MSTLTTQKNHGYSLIEIIVYLAIFSVMSIVVIDSFLVVSKSFDATRANRDLLESGQISMERMSREISQAESISASASTLGTNPGVLSLASTDSSGNPITVEFIVENGSLNLYENGALVGPLTDPNISVDSLVFRRIVTAEGEAVKIEMTLTTLASPVVTHADFYDTIVLQGEYKLYW